MSVIFKTVKRPSDPRVENSQKVLSATYHTGKVG